MFTTAVAGRFGRALILLLAACLSGCGGEETPVVSEERIAALRAESAAFAGRDAQALRSDAAALALGRELFDAHCAACHGTEDRAGARGTPALATAVLDYGDSVAAVRTTITQGRHSIMPNHGGMMGEVDLGALVAYVRSLASGEDMGNFRQSAETLYGIHCVACHGPDGLGNPAAGIPDLTDDYWQHGESMMNVRLAITRGTESICPAQGDSLSSAEIELLTAYVLDLRDG